MAQDTVTGTSEDTPQTAAGSLGFVDVVILLVERWRSLVLVPLCIGMAALGVTYLIAPTFTARTVFLPPQQQQSLAVSAMASLGALSGLAGGVAGIRNPIDQYVALLQSTTVADRIIDKFELMRVYNRKYRMEARKDLAKSVRVSGGRRDGLITVEVDDEDPQRAADMANRHVDELRHLTGQLALSEAQQRRAFFETQLKQTRDRLTEAQRDLQASGFSSGALKAEPRTAAEGYARLRAEVTAAEVRLQTLRGNLADAAPEVQQQSATVVALRSELGKLEVSTDLMKDAGYVGKYREFKYQETLFDLFARQYEMARLDESREGALIQVVDAATPPEKKSRPARALTAIVATLVTFVLTAGLLAFLQVRAQSVVDPVAAAKWRRLGLTLGRK